MSLKFNAKNGTGIRIITEMINRENEPKNVKPRNVKPAYKSGSMSSQDLRFISMGLEVLHRMMNEAFRAQENKLLLGEQDVSKVRKEAMGYRGVMDDFIFRLVIGARDEHDIRKRIDLLEDYSQIAQAARDGIIIKQGRRQEKIAGESKEVIYDTSMSQKEVISILMDYERQTDRLQFKKLDSYLGLGLGFAGIIGNLAKGSKTDNNKGTGSLISLGTTAVAGLKLIQGISKQGERERLGQLRDQQFRMRDDLLGNEQISSRAEKDAIRSIEDLSREESRLGNQIENKRLLFDVSIDLAIAIISGLYINKQIQIKDNGKIDGKSLATALIALQGTRGVVGNFLRAVQGFQKSRQGEQEYKELCKRVKDILLQMEEKVYPLEGAKAPFDSMQIENLRGQFYPKKDYETDEVHYSTTIDVPEFSMRRGDVVLLSGESGSGKSTFLRLLKRGDINNRGCIKLDNGQTVDNLGDEYISFRPSINLGDESNVLSQITGKQNVSDLDEKERQNLIKILGELNLDFPNLLDQLASKKFMEFSTGQQRRLALSKLFYRIDDGTSVIIVDEPVGNVEDKLIREQLEMIRKYAKDKNVMLLLTTHRLDLAEDLATKRYHIKNGVLEQVLVKEKANVER